MLVVKPRWLDSATMRSFGLAAEVLEEIDESADGHLDEPLHPIVSLTRFSHGDDLVVGDGRSRVEAIQIPIDTQTVDLKVKDRALVTVVSPSFQNVA